MNSLPMTMFNRREIIALKPDTSPEVLHQLATDENYCVRWCVASNPNTPLEVLKLLVTDKEYHVRLYALRNPNCTELIRRLFLMTDHKLQKEWDTQ